MASREVFKLSRFVLSHSARVLSSSLSSDDISGMIDEAEREAVYANRTASNTMDRLNNIQKEIDKIKVTPANSNLSNALNDVDQTGESLGQCFS